MFDRIIENTIKEKINGGKAIVVVGARQVGKTTLLNKILNKAPASLMASYLSAYSFGKVNGFSFC